MPVGPATVAAEFDPPPAGDAAAADAAGPNELTPAAPAGEPTRYCCEGSVAPLAERGKLVRVDFEAAEARQTSGSAAAAAVQVRRGIGKRRGLVHRCCARAVWMGNNNNNNKNN